MVDGMPVATCGEAEAHSMLEWPPEGRQQVRLHRSDLQERLYQLVDMCGGYKGSGGNVNTTDSRDNHNELHDDGDEDIRNNARYRGVKSNISTPN